MNIGNRLYSSLSQLARQAFLMLSELPTILNVFDTDYKLEYSESYSATVQQQSAIEGYQYCTSLQGAFESLVSDNYTNFILTVECIGVAVYCNGNISFKIFDSYARDLCGRAHPEGTCVFLEVSSLDFLIHYIKSIYNNHMLELKGVGIESVQNSFLFYDSIRSHRLQSKF